MSAVDYTWMDCKLFVGASKAFETADDLDEAVHGLIGGTLDRGQVEAHPVGLIVSHNDDAKRDLAPAFLSFPFLVEVYFTPDTSQAERVAIVSKLITDLRSRGSPVVAACDYEDELPKAVSSRL